MESTYLSLFVILLLFLKKCVLMSNVSVTREMETNNARPSHYLKSSTLAVSTRHYEPYMYQNINGKYYRGIEYMLLKTIAEMLKINLTFQTTSKDSSLYSNILLNNSDIYIGGLYPNSLGLNYTMMSFPYISDDLTWCIRKAEIIPKYLTLFLIAPGEVWCSAIFIYGYIGGFILHLMISFDTKYKQRNNRDWHYSILIALTAGIGISTRFYPISGRLRIYYGIMLIGAVFGFQIVAVYFLKFIQFQIPYHQISSIDEITENNFHLIGSEEVFRIIAENEKYPSRQIDSFEICNNTNECLNKLLHFDDVAVGGSRQHILNLATNSPSKIYCFDQTQQIGSYSIALYMRSNLPLQPTIDRLIQKLFEAGLFVKWNRDSRRQRNYEIPQIQSFQLTVRDMSFGLVFFSGLGSLVFIGTFVCEHIIFWKMKQQNTHKVWIYFEQLVDGHRHYFQNLPERLERKNKYRTPNILNVR